MLRYLAANLILAVASLRSLLGCIRADIAASSTVTELGLDICQVEFVGHQDRH
jgi:hypothetical protein